MSEITLEAIEAKQTELAKLIAQFKSQPVETGRTIELYEQAIELKPGEQYAGAVLDADGEPVRDLILMAATPGKKLNWQAAMDWATSVGGVLPNRQEQALLYANCKPHLKPEWHWSSETHADDASFAWICHFGNGSQGGNRKSCYGCAVAVRRV